MDTVKSTVVATLRDLAAHAHSSSSIVWLKNTGQSRA